MVIPEKKPPAGGYLLKKLSVKKTGILKIGEAIKFLQLLAEIKVEIDTKYMLYYMHSRRSVMS